MFRHRLLPLSHLLPANNLYALARGAFFAVIPLELAVVSTHGDESTAAVTHAFIGVCAWLLVLSQQFHAWAHRTKGRVPRWVEALQRAGVLISRDMHRAHHKMPYNNNYCIVSGLWNKLLDDNKVFDIVEMVVFFVFGVRPRSWGAPTVEWMEKKKEEG
ncbi:uncharacterized protein A4U43_C08F25980 [Asparagus officinalis]|nr:uncharacterized protein A4U43_C08F25980 [Asparagus officinalis]